LRSKSCSERRNTFPPLVAERLMRFAECVGRDNLMAGTDCGLI
jgi:hypothetical protein